MLSADRLREIGFGVAAELGLAGGQAAVSVDGVVAEAGYGDANRELDLAVTEDTVFQIGSASKLYAALLVMQLVDDGLIDLDKPVSSYLPDVTLAADGEARAITPRQLLSMSSGMDNGPYRDTGRGDDAIANYVAGLGGIPLIHPPGGRFSYSNASTCVSGLLVERMRNMSWEDAVRERILRAGGFQHSVSLFDELPYHRVAVGHHPGVVGAHRPWHYGRGMGPTGSVIAASAGDLCRFATLFLELGAAPNGTRLLSPRAVDQIQTPQVRVPARDFALDWCLGPFHKRWGGSDVFGHPGTVENGASMVVWIPEHRVAMAVTTNTPPQGAQHAARMFEAVLRDELGLSVADDVDPETDAVSVGIDRSIYTGKYEALAREYTVTLDDGELWMHAVREVGYDTAVREVEMVSARLRPVGRHRFHSDNPAMTWNFGWEVAFALDDGRARTLYNGAWGARRVD